MKKQDQEEILDLIAARRKNTTELRNHFQRRKHEVESSGGDSVTRAIMLAGIDAKIERLENENENLRYLSDRVAGMPVEPVPGPQPFSWILPMLVDMAVAQRRDDAFGMLSALGVLELYLADVRRRCEAQIALEGGGK